MAFIEKTDLYSAIRQEELQQITRGDDALIYFAIDSATAEIKSYLSYGYFDVNFIFAQTGNNRNKLLMNYLIDITLYIMVSVALPGQDLEDRRARYKRAIDWLKSVKNGEIYTDLPKITVSEEATAKPRGAVGKHDKRNNYY